MSFEESLVLLLIGAGITYGLGAGITRTYQKKQKQQDLEREDYQREIGIKDDLIRQFSEILPALENMVESVQLVQLTPKDVEEIKKLLERFGEMNKINIKLLFLIRLYFDEEDVLYRQLSSFSILCILIKNYSLAKNEKIENEIKKILSELNKKEFSKEPDDYMTEMGLPENFYTEITKKSGLWAFDFSQKILDSKLKT